MTSENSGDVGPQRITPSSPGRVEAQSRGVIRELQNANLDSPAELMADADELRSLARKISRERFSLRSCFARTESLAMVRDISALAQKIEGLAATCHARARELAARNG